MSLATLKTTLDVAIGNLADEWPDLPDIPEVRAFVQSALAGMRGLSAALDLPRPIDTDRMVTMGLYAVELRGFGFDRHNILAWLNQINAMVVEPPLTELQLRRLAKDAVEATPEQVEHYRDRPV